MDYRLIEAARSFVAALKNTDDRSLDETNQRLANAANDADDITEESILTHLTRAIRAELSRRDDL
jgi:hypothetical protein